MTSKPKVVSDSPLSPGSPRTVPAQIPVSKISHGLPGHGVFVFSVQHRHTVPSLHGAFSGRPTQSSGNWGSAFSTSSVSYAQSTVSINSTLSSATTTDPSSVSSTLFDTSNPSQKPKDGSSNLNVFARKLKEIYRTISGLENKLLGNGQEHMNDNGDRGLHSSEVHIKGSLAGTGVPRSAANKKEESERWRKLVSEHRALAESIHEMLTLTLSPTVPAFLKNIPQKYNLIIRLWAHAFCRLLEPLRHAAHPPTTSPIALEYLQQFLNYAYVFYGGLSEERNFAQYRGAFLEALGNLSRYWMAVSTLVEETHAPSNNLTASAVAKNNILVSHLPKRSPPNATSDVLDLPSNAVSPTPARIDDSPQFPEAEIPVGGDAIAGGVVLLQTIPSASQKACLMELNPDKERWRQVAKIWFARGLSITPNSGKLQHHLGLLCHDNDSTDEELRGMYHFVKSMIVFHPFLPARKSILAMWLPSAQARRQAPGACLSELFVCLHGMLFMNIQLDDFKRVLGRFQEKLEIGGKYHSEQVEEREWIMMALINIGSLFEYGQPTAVLHHVAGIETHTPGAPGASPVLANGTTGKIKVLMAKCLKGDMSKMDIDDVEIDRSTLQPGELPSPITPEAELPTALKLAMELTFVMLSHTLRHPRRRPSKYSALNPYNTIILTFLATVLRDQTARSALERAVPWDDLAAFLSSIPRCNVLREHQKVSAEGGLLLTSGLQPLPEDWCIRGMGWGGKNVYECRLWAKDAEVAGEGQNELEVLDREGVNSLADNHHRCVRLTRAGLWMARDVHGFNFVLSSDGHPCWHVEGSLAEKITQWHTSLRLPGSPAVS